MIYILVVWQSVLKKFSWALTTCWKLVVVLNPII